MRLFNDDIELLFFDYFEGNLNERDKLKLMNLIHQNPELEKEFSSWAQSYSLKNEPLEDYGIQESLLKERSGFKFKYLIWSGLLILLLSLPFIYFTNNKMEVNKENELIVQPEEPANRAEKLTEKEVKTRKVKPEVSKAVEPKKIEADGVVKEMLPIGEEKVTGDLGSGKATIEETTTRPVAVDNGGDKASQHKEIDEKLSNEHPETQHDQSGTPEFGLAKNAGVDSATTAKAVIKPVVVDSTELENSGSIVNSNSAERNSQNKNGKSGDTELKKKKKRKFSLKPEPNFLPVNPNF